MKRRSKRIWKKIWPEVVATFEKILEEKKDVIAGNLCPLPCCQYDERGGYQVVWEETLLSTFGTLEPTIGFAVYGDGRNATAYAANRRIIFNSAIYPGGREWTDQVIRHELAHLISPLNVGHNATWVENALAMGVTEENIRLSAKAASDWYGGSDELNSKYDLTPLEKMKSA